MRLLTVLALATCFAYPASALTLAPGDVLVGRPANFDSGRESDVVRVDLVSGTFEVLTSGGALQSPNNIVTDHSGNVIVANWQGGDLVSVDPRQFAPGGPTNQTIVGSGDALRFPTGLAIDSEGFLYVAAGGFGGMADGHVVRVDPSRYDPAKPEANQELVASGGLIGFQGGIVVDESGTLFVASRGDNVVVAIDPDSFDPGDVESNQSVVASVFRFPAYLTIDSTGLLFVAVLGGDEAVYRVDPSSYDPADPPGNRSVVATAPVEDLGALAIEGSGRLLMLDSDNFPYHHDLVRIDQDAFDPGQPSANQTLVASIEDIAEGFITLGLWVVPVPEPSPALLHLSAVATLAGISLSRRRRH